MESQLKTDHTFGYFPLSLYKKNFFKTLTWDPQNFLWPGVGGNEKEEFWVPQTSALEPETKARKRGELGVQRGGEETRGEHLRVVKAYVTTDCNCDSWHRVGR